MSYRVPLSSLIAVLVLSLSTGIARAEGDADAGAVVFKKCVACHNVNDTKNKVGPHLVGIFGRAAGAVADFKYSPAMSGSGIVWNEETIAAYLKDPRGYVKGNRMAFAGLKKDEDIANVIAYLKRETSQ